MKNINIISGFKSSVIWPIIFAEMQSWCSLFNDGGGVEPWFICIKVCAVGIIATTSTNLH